MGYFKFYFLKKLFYSFKRLLSIKTLLFIIIFILFLMSKNNCFAEDLTFTYNNKTYTYSNFENFNQGYYLVIYSSNYTHIFTSSVPFISTWSGGEIKAGTTYKLQTFNYYFNNSTTPVFNVVRCTNSDRTHWSSSFGSDYTISLNINSYIPIYSNFDFYRLIDSDKPYVNINNYQQYGNLNHSNDVAPTITDYPSIVNDSISIGDEEMDSIWIDPRRIICKRYN